MGIRVDAASLDRQLTKAGCDDRRALTYHKMLLEGKLPCTIGGGIGQSRLCMRHQHHDRRRKDHHADRKPFLIRDRLLWGWICNRFVMLFTRL